MTDTRVLVRCRRCGFPVAEQDGGTLRVYREAVIGGREVRVTCQNRDPFDRGRCRAVTVIVTETRRQEAGACE